MISLKLSVIVPVYKTEAYLRKCVESILTQTLTDFELILIDDGSPDNCPEICDEYSRTDDRVKVIHKKNGGQGLARKLGVTLACGEYIAFVDSDDWIEPQMYKTLCRTADENACDMVICDWTYQYVEKNNQVPYSQRHILKEKYIYEDEEVQNDILSKILLEEIHCSPCNKLYRSNILKKCNLEKTIGLTNMQDWVLNYEYFRHCNRIIYINEYLYNYVIHQAGSLRGEYKDYFSVVLRLHKYRMMFYNESNLNKSDHLRRRCIDRFICMSMFAAFDYEFIFKDTTILNRLKRISAVVNNSEVLYNIGEYHPEADILNRIKFFLFKLKNPVIIYGFVKIMNVIVKIKKIIYNSDSIVRT
jgi:glycosyltransferase involved in cell wall biosynthesis